MQGGSAVSLWDLTAPEPDVTGSAFEPGMTADVVVVGGGYTGLSTALHCAGAGLSVLLLEAERIGHGGSGRNVGLVNAGVWLPPAEVRRALGDEYGPRFLRCFSDGPQTVFDLIEKHQIRCEATRNGTIHAAHAPSGMAGLRARHQEWQRVGEPVDLLTREEVTALTGLRAFHGGLFDHRAGTINPMGYCRGLARAALAAGAKICTGLRVTGLAREGDGWKVETAQGAVTAKNVVLGTNAYTDGLWPGLGRTFRTLHYFQVVTEPLGEEADGILPGGQGLWDTGTIMVSIRRDAAGRILLGSMGRIFGTPDSGISARWARRQLRRLLPELREVALEQAWHGKFAMTSDHLPRIHRLAEGLWTPIGYNGRGITTGTIFGQAMAGVLTGEDPATLPLPVTDARPEPAARLVAGVYEAALAAHQVWRGIA